MKKSEFRFHQVGLYHLPASKKYLPCAYTQNVVNLIAMLRSLGHEVIYYGSEGAETQANEQVVTHTLQDIYDSFGNGDNRFELGYDWTKGNTFRYDEKLPLSPVHLKFRNNVITEVSKRYQEGDFLLLPQGGETWGKYIAGALQIPATCEPGIGYHDPIARFKAYESASLMNLVHGKWYGENKNTGYKGKLMDTVIPNYFDDNDFPDVKYEKGDEKGEYFLYMGRPIPAKGIGIAQKVTQKLGKRLLFAGQRGDIDLENAEYVGVVNDPKRKAELLGGATAVFVPSLYIEPFGGVNVEAQLCGTPAITTDFGVFKETVVQGVTGFRCSTFQEFIESAKNAHTLDANFVRLNAQQYLMSNVKWQYQSWFERIHNFIEEVRKTGSDESWFNV